MEADGTSNKRGAYRGDDHYFLHFRFWLPLLLQVVPCAGLRPARPRDTREHGVVFASSLFSRASRRSLAKNSAVGENRPDQGAGTNRSPLSRCLRDPIAGQCVAVVAAMPSAKSGDHKNRHSGRPRIQGFLKMFSGSIMMIPVGYRGRRHRDCSEQMVGCS